METQNLHQSSSQPIDFIAFLANVMDREGDNTSPTPTFKYPRIGEANSINESRSTSILKHNGIIEEDDQEIFVNTLDDRPTPVSSIPLRVEESKMLSLVAYITLVSLSQRMEDPTMIGEDRHDLNKGVSV